MRDEVEEIAFADDDNFVFWSRKWFSVSGAEFEKNIYWLELMS